MWIPYLDSVDWCSLSGLFNTQALPPFVIHLPPGPPHNFTIVCFKIITDSSPFVIHLPPGPSHNITIVCFKIITDSSLFVIHLPPGPSHNITIVCFEVITDSSPCSSVTVHSRGSREMAVSKMEEVQKLIDGWDGKNISQLCNEYITGNFSLYNFLSFFHVG